MDLSSEQKLDPSKNRHRVALSKLVNPNLKKVK
jgi:hypothetical protein